MNATREWLDINIQRIPQRYRQVEADAEEVGSGLYLFGPTGTGKTHKAAGIMRTLLEDGQAARWLTVPTWLYKSKLAMNDDDVNVESVPELLRGHLLILDDIGVERPTDWALETLYVLINEAYNRQVPLVVTGNMTLARLADKMGTRIVDRLAHICRPIEMAGPNMRRSG